MIRHLSNATVTRVVVKSKLCRREGPGRNLEVDTQHGTPQESGCGPMCVKPLLLPHTSHVENDCDRLTFSKGSSCRCFRIVVERPSLFLVFSSFFAFFSFFDFFSFFSFFCFFFFKILTSSSERRLRTPALLKHSRVMVHQKLRLHGIAMGYDVARRL